MHTLLSWFDETSYHAYNDVLNIRLGIVSEKPLAPADGSGGLRMPRGTERLQSASGSRQSEWRPLERGRINREACQRYGFPRDAQPTSRGSLMRQQHLEATDNLRRQLISLVNIWRPVGSRTFRFTLIFHFLLIPLIYCLNTRISESSKVVHF